MKGRQYLTKSTFKVGLECPRKLYYLNKPDEYFNDNEEDPFLQALARGGYQVGALAQLKYKNGVEVKSKNHQEALEETAKLLQQDNAAVFEGAFSVDKFFVRADIVLKAKNSLRIIEVKSKSLSPDEEFIKKSKPGKAKGIQLLTKWLPYFYDIAFQVFVARKQYPQLKISCSLMGLDKTAASPEDGIHQIFLVRQKGKGKEVFLTREPGPQFKGFNLLKEIDVTDIINEIIDGNEKSEFHIAGSFSEKAAQIRDIFLNDQKFPIKEAPGPHCKSCQFRGQSPSLKSGFDECWTEFANIKAASSKAMSFDLWNFRGSLKAFQNEKYLLENLDEQDLGDGFASERQAIIIQKIRSGDKTPWFDKDGFLEASAQWKWPLHFIDFETCMPAIPFKKGFAPYSEIAFQFSHHVLEKSGEVRHAGEFIDLTPGTFPTFHFLRELKKQLSTDEGSIFRYSGHENHVLNRAIFLLEKSSEPDKKELIDFFKTITEKKEGDKILWQGKRKMIDLLDLVKDYYFSPLMGNSNSLKYVLPAILQESKFLQKKYGSKDPYADLEPIFPSEEMKKIENIMSDEDNIRNGGAAMMAYCKSQFTEMSAQEREFIRLALLRYCKLDTLAMVMLVEYWLDLVKA